MGGRPRDHRVRAWAFARWPAPRLCKGFGQRIGWASYEAAEHAQTKPAEPESRGDPFCRRSSRFSRRARRYARRDTRGAALWSAASISGLRALACPTIAASGAVSTSIIAAPWRRRFSTIRERSTSFRLSGKDRFTALQSGEVDLLSRNTTWTQSREAGQGLLFTGINYFDGQGFLVRKSLGQ